MSQIELISEACCFDGWHPDGLPEGGGAEWASFWCGEDEPIVAEYDAAPVICHWDEDGRRDLLSGCNCGQFHKPRAAVPFLHGHGVAWFQWGDFTCYFDR